MRRSTTRPDATSRRFEVGSRAFFEGMPGFTPKDTDVLIIEDEPEIYKTSLQLRKMDGTRCIFKWRHMTADEFIAHTETTRLAMELGKFLVPAVAKYLGITADHLRRLEPVAERLDEKHAYERIILRAYIENGGFFMTADQRAEAYESYKEARHGRE